MNQRPVEGILKHADFIVLDIICLQLCFVLAYWINSGYGNPYRIPDFQYQAEMLLLSQFFTIVFSNNYKDILKRDSLEEFAKTLLYSLTILLIYVVFLFLFHTTAIASRMQTGITLTLFVFAGFVIRILNKKRIMNKSTFGYERRGKSLILITVGALVDEAMHKLTGTDEYMDHFVSGVILTDDDRGSVKGKYDIPIVFLSDDGIERLRTKWVDEVLILQPSNTTIDRDLLDTINEMGITVHFTLALLNDDDWPSLEVGRIGEYKVLTSSIKSITAGQAFAKRCMDIAGGIVGCIITCILFFFVAPAIYIKSPGPIFFKQKRVGLNGRIFDVYKFRSMYLDAEDRKAELMDQNKVKSDLMFKMDDDPRIIRGVGHFIRKTSIDEFPQFFNVLSGTMSLVGTRPPLLSEWEQYDIHHRARMTVKPGITGLWQISGRSEITDFEEVVKLDRQYIENWSLKEDIRIILKTIVVVLKRKGAE